VIPKFHGAKLTDIPDEDLSEILVCSQSLWRADETTQYSG
jgi:hypothetical protein